MMKHNRQVFLISTHRIILALQMATIMFLVSNANAECLSEIEYKKLPMKWIEIKQGINKNWPPPNQYVLFHYGKIKNVGKDEFRRFRICSIVSCPSDNARGIQCAQGFDNLYKDIDEPTHWMPLTEINAWPCW